MKKEKKYGFKGFSPVIKFTEKSRKKCICCVLSILMLLSPNASLVSNAYAASPSNDLLSSITSETVNNGALNESLTDQPSGAGVAAQNDGVPGSVYASSGASAPATTPSIEPQSSFTESVYLDNPGSSINEDDTQNQNTGALSVEGSVYGSVYEANNSVSSNSLTSQYQAINGSAVISVTPSVNVYPTGQVVVVFSSAPPIGYMNSGSFICTKGAPWQEYQLNDCFFDWAVTASEDRLTWIFTPTTAWPSYNIIYFTYKYTIYNFGVWLVVDYSHTFSFSTSGPITVLSVSPNTGPVVGGTPVIIRGSNFTGATAVYFGTTAATSFTVNSDTEIQAISPPGRGTVDVTVTGPGGTSALSPGDRFTYAITISPSSLPTAAAECFYSQTFSASGGTAPYIFSITAGSLPAGLVLSSDGVLSGTPTATGTYPITITATDANGITSSQGYTLTVNSPTITVSPDSLTDAMIGQPYIQTFSASGGIAPYTFSMSGTLPAGLKFSNGVLSGIPKAVGSFPVTVTATDAGQFTGSRSYILYVDPPSLNHPKIISPKDGSSLTQGDVDAKWSKVRWATNYILALRDFTTNTLLIDSLNVGNANKYTIPSSTLTSGNNYRLAVAAVSGNEVKWAEAVFSKNNQWYYLELNDSKGNQVEIYLSDLQESGPGPLPCVTAAGSTSNSTAGLQAYVKTPGSALGTFYRYNNGAWIAEDSGSASPSTGSSVICSVSGSVYSVTSDADSISDSVYGVTAESDAALSLTVQVPDWAKAINLQSAQIINKIEDEFLAKVGLSRSELTAENLKMISYGIIVSYDDNVAFGLGQHIWKITSLPEDNFYFMRAKTYADAVFVATFACITAGSTIAAYKALQAAGELGTLAAATSETGVGGAAFGVAALGSLALAGALAGVAWIAGRMTGQSIQILKADMAKLEQIPRFKIFKGIEAEVTKIQSAEEVNKPFIDKGYEAPVKPGTKAYVFKWEGNAEGYEFVRVYSSKKGNIEGQWCMKAADLKGLTPDLIRDKFGLEYTPDMIAKVDPVKHCTMRGSIANGAFGTNGGGVQLDFIGQDLGEVAKFSDLGDLQTWLNQHP